MRRDQVPVIPYVSGSGLPIPLSGSRSMSSISRLRDREAGSEHLTAHPDTGVGAARVGGGHRRPDHFVQQLRCAGDPGVHQCGHPVGDGRVGFVAELLGCRDDAALCAAPRGRGPHLDVPDERVPIGDATGDVVQKGVEPNICHERARQLEDLISSRRGRPRPPRTGRSRRRTDPGRSGDGGVDVELQTSSSSGTPSPVAAEYAITGVPGNRRARSSSTALRSAAASVSILFSAITSASASW